MNLSIQKWGNSLAFRIPSAIAKDIHLHRGSEVEIDVVNGNIMLKPARQKKYSLSKLLKKISKSNLHSEQDWGAPLGKEVW